MKLLIDEIRNPNLDIIRGLAIVIVIFAHLGFFCWGNYEKEPLLSKIIGYSGSANANGSALIFEKILIATHSKKIDYGIIGVGLFYLLSGYLFAQQSLTEKTKNLFIKRFFRILIPIFAIYFLIFRLIFTGQDFNFISRLSPLGFFLYPFQIPDAGILWSINVELFFYFIFLTFRPNNLPKISGAILFLLALRHAGIEQPYFSNDFYFQWQIFILIGCAFAFKQRFSHVILLAVFLITASFISKWHSPLLQSAVISYLMFWGILNIKNSPALLNKIFGFLSKISYSLYLLHLAILAVSTYWLQKVGIALDIALLLGIAAAIFISYLSAITLERFSIFLGRNFFYLKNYEIIFMIRRNVLLFFKNLKI